MTDCGVVLFVAVMSLLVSLFVVFHHRYKHGDNKELSSLQKWFQCSDVCNFQTWNHEQFVVFFFILSIVFFVMYRNCG